MGRLTPTLSFGVARFAGKHAVNVNVVHVNEALALVRTLVKDDLDRGDDRTAKYEWIGGAYRKAISATETHARPVGMAGNGRVRSVGAAKEVVGATISCVDVEARGTRDAVSVIADGKAKFADRNLFNSVNDSSGGCISVGMRNFSQIVGVI